MPSTSGGVLRQQRPHRASLLHSVQVSMPSTSGGVLRLARQGGEDVQADQFLCPRRRAGYCDDGQDSFLTISFLVSMPSTSGGVLRRNDDMFVLGRAGLVFLCPRRRAGYCDE